MHKARVLFVVTLGALAIGATSVSKAALFRAYLSSTGSDSNPCTVVAPCRLLPKALSVTSEGGEIWMLDSANYNTAQVDVSKSVTLLAVPGATGSLVATGGGDAIFISGVGIHVVLRNLVIVSLGPSTNGIEFAQGDTLLVEDCEISNMSGGAIEASAGAVSVRHAVLRDSGTGFDATGAVVAVLDGVHAERNSIGVRANSGARLTVTNSVLAWNATGGHALAAGGAITRLTVSHSTIQGRNGEASNIQGLRAEATATSGVTIIVDANVIMGSGNSLVFANAGGEEVMFTRQNNVIFDTTEAVRDGTLLNLGAF